MNEGEWNHRGDLDAMLAFIAPKLSDRQLRLFAAHCCRRVAPLMTTDLLQSLDTAVELADGNVDSLQRRKARSIIFDAACGDKLSNQAILLGQGAAKQAVGYCLHQNIREYFSPALSNARHAVAAILECSDSAAHLLSQFSGFAYSNGFVEAEKGAQAGILRHFTGSYLWLNDGAPNISFSKTAIGLARQIYDSQSMDQVQTLHDTLSLEFGNSDCPFKAEILSHLEPSCDRILRRNRLAGTHHPRGCWVLEFILRTL